MQLFLLIVLLFVPYSIGNYNANKHCNVSDHSTEQIHQIIDEYLMGEGKHLLRGNQAVGDKVLKTDSIMSYTHLSDLSLSPDGEILAEKVFRSNNGDASISVSTGSIITGGGIGVAKDSFIGGKLELSQSTLLALKVDSTEESSSTSTGSTVIDGGVGIAKNLHVGGNVYANQFISNGGVSSWTLQYSQYQVVSYTNSIARTSLLGNAVGTFKVPSAVFFDGTAFTIFASGYYSTSASGNSVTFELETQGNLLVTAFTTDLPPGATGNTNPWSLEFRCTFFNGAIGGSSCINRMTIGIATDVYDFQVSRGGSITFDESVDGALNLYATMSTQSPSNGIGIYILTVSYSSAG